MSTVHLDGNAVPYTIQRSRRRTIAATISADLSVLVKAPYFIPEFVIRRFLEEKKDWIVKKLQERQTHAGRTMFGGWETGDTIHFFDRLLTVQISASEQATAARLYQVNDTFQVILPIDTSPEARRHEVKRLIHDWYRKRTLPELKRRVSAYAKMMGLDFETIRVKDVSSHWGSCSVRRNLNFNYRIAMVPPDLADYVIIHELCHLKEMNHSARFWALVAQYCPDYREKRRRLKVDYAIME
ncbi:MAG: M48 family metallopeptidase [Patescibacteria group bacterium]|nr:M48 family metallopeptidase [Patescibacteria group bacterium]